MPDVGRVLRGVNVPGQRVDDFLAISPLVADNIEFGFTVTLDWLRFQASYFQSRSKFGVRLVADADGVLRVNREKTRIRGFEATLEAQVNDNITAGANLSILNGRVDTNDDGVLDADLDGVNIGPDRLNLYLAGEYGNFTGRIQAAILFDRNFDDAAGSLTAEFNGYTVVDLYAGYRFSFGTVQLGIQNLLDENYITYYSQVGTTRNDRFFAGRGRTFTLAYQVTF